MGEAAISPRESWWRRWLVAPVVAQLTVGISPERIGWTIALGIVLGVFPIMGSTTLISLLVGWILHLNQPVLHVFKTLVYPLHLALILVFIRLGERLYGVPLIAFSIPQMIAKFKADPLLFAQDFGMAAWHGVCQTFANCWELSDELPHNLAEKCNPCRQGACPAVG